MIGLDFVKKIDKEWKTHITFADGTPYYDNYCPLSGAKCRLEDCSFWNKNLGMCGYITNEDNNKNKEIIRLEKMLDSELS